LRRSARCSVITQRARMQQRPSQRPPPFLHVRHRALWLECGPVEKKKRPLPPRQRATWLSALHAGGEKRGHLDHLAAPGRQTKSGEDIAYREGPLASDIGSFSHGRAPCRHLEHKISLHKAASKVRYIVIFNNGSTTGPNGVSELGLAPHRATVLTNKLPPRAGVGGAPVSPALAAGLPLAVAEQ
jgi:hypothetical protein